MSVIIKGMEMPKSCEDCRLSYTDQYGVTICAACDDCAYSVSCPLVHLPEGHGRIVDAAEILEKAKNSPWFDGDVSELGLLLGSEVTTIVPAEGGKADG